MSVLLVPKLSISQSHIDNSDAARAATATERNSDLFETSIGHILSKLSDVVHHELFAGDIAKTREFVENIILTKIKQHRNLENLDFASHNPNYGERVILREIITESIKEIFKQRDRDSFEKAIKTTNSFQEELIKALEHSGKKSITLSGLSKLVKGLWPDSYNTEAKIEDLQDSIISILIDGQKIEGKNYGRIKVKLEQFDDVFDTISNHLRRTNFDYVLELSTLEEKISQLFWVTSELREEVIRDVNQTPPSLDTSLRPYRAY